MVALKAVAAAAPAPAPPGSLPDAFQAPLTTAERLSTAVEVRNGTHTKNLAHQTRSLLRREGFTVATIGDQRYYAATKTRIYYRPGAEKLPGRWAVRFFRKPNWPQSKKLKKGMDILVLLRGDLLENPQVLARLNDGGAPPIYPQPPRRRYTRGRQDRDGAATLSAPVQGELRPNLSPHRRQPT